MCCVSMDIRGGTLAKFWAAPLQAPFFTSAKQTCRGRTPMFCAQGDNYEAISSAREISGGWASRQFEPWPVPHDNLGSTGISKYPSSGIGRIAGEAVFDRHHHHSGSSLRRICRRCLLSWNDRCLLSTASDRFRLAVHRGAAHGPVSAVGSGDHAPGAAPPALDGGSGGAAHRDLCLARQAAPGHEGVAGPVLGHG